VTEENHNAQEPGLGNDEPGAPADGAGPSESAPAGEQGHEGSAAEPSPSPTVGEPIAPSAPRAPIAPPPAAPGQRRISRHTTMRTETSTDETVVETIAVAPPVYAAPSGEHPRPVG
jgi:hypothetical protein